MDVISLSRVVQGTEARTWKILSSFRSKCPKYEKCWDEWVSCTQCKLGVRMQVIFNRCGMENTYGTFSEEWKFDWVCCQIQCHLIKPRDSLSWQSKSNCMHNGKCYWSHSRIKSWQSLCFSREIFFTWIPLKKTYKILSILTY